MTRRRGILALLLSLALLASGCASLPTSGPVTSGGTLHSDDSEIGVNYLPDAPHPGARPEDIVRGFVEAASSPADGWKIARLFLAPGTAWNPGEAVIVDSIVERKYAPSQNGAAVDLTLTQTASVDATGVYESDSSGSVDLSYSLARQADGEWRITKAPPGIVLDRGVFPQVFQSYSLMFFTPGWDALVPDQRWFPRNSAASRVTAALLAGPAPWLAGVVQSAFPADAHLSRESVVVSSGVAQVWLDPIPNLDGITASRMRTQLEKSMLRDVSLTIGDSPVPETAPLAVRPLVDSRALVRNAKGDYGFLTGSDFEAVPPLQASVGDRALTALSWSAASALFAMQGGDGKVYRAKGGEPAQLVDGRAGLIAPAVDPAGFVWSVPASSPRAFLAIGPNDQRVQLAVNWTGITSIQAMQVSRDGTRLLVAATLGGKPILAVAGIQHGQNGAPAQLGDLVTLASLSSPAVSVAWLDDLTGAAVVPRGEESDIVEQPVGGATTVSRGPRGIVEIAGVNSSANVWLRSSSGALYQRRGSTWQRVAADVALLAKQM